MRITLLFMATMLLASCGGSSTYWRDECIITTDAQRAAIKEHTERILNHTPASLAGHDQDWDDAIAAAHQQATMLYCTRFSVEYDCSGAGPCRKTGQYKEMTFNPTNVIKP